MRTSSVASRAAHGLNGHTARPSEVLESWTPSQERRGQCQEPDTTSASNAQTVEDGSSSVFVPKHTVAWGQKRSRSYLAFRAAIGDRQAVSWTFKTIL